MSAVSTDLLEDLTLSQLAVVADEFLPDGVGRVYVIESMTSGRFKVGYTARSVAKRLRELQTGSHEQLKLTSVRVGSRMDKACLQNALSDYSVRGEWFGPEGQDKCQAMFLIMDALAEEGRWPEPLEALRKSHYLYTNSFSMCDTAGLSVRDLGQTLALYEGQAKDDPRYLDTLRLAYSMAEAQRARHTECTVGHLLLAGLNEYWAKFNGN